MNRGNPKHYPGKQRKAWSWDHVNLSWYRSWVVSRLPCTGICATFGVSSLRTAVKVRTHDATLRAILRATCQLHRVSTSEIVARNIARNAARVEASSTSATLQATIAPSSRFAQHCTQCRDVNNWNRPIRAPVKFCACRGKNKIKWQHTFFGRPRKKKRW